MYCENCGAVLGENDLFCQYCGFKVSLRKTPEAPAAEPEPEYASGAVSEVPAAEYEKTLPEPEYAGQAQSKEDPEYRYGSFPASDGSYMYGSSPYEQRSTGAFPAIKAQGSSGLFLAGIIIYILFQIFNLFSSLFGAFDVDSIVYDLTGEASAAGNIIMLGVIFSFLISIVMTAGMLMYYVSAKKKQELKVKTAGLSVCRIAAAISFAAVAIGLFIGFVVCIFAAVVVSRLKNIYEDNETVELSIVGVWLLIGLAALILVIGIFMIMYYVKILVTLKVMISAAKTGTAVRNVSRYVIVFGFIQAGIALIAALVSIFAPAVMITYLLCCAENIIFPIILIKYRKDLAPYISVSYDEFEAAQQ